MLRNIRVNFINELSDVKVDSFDFEVFVNVRGVAKQAHQIKITTQVVSINTTWSK